MNASDDPHFAVLGTFVSGNHGVQFFEIGNPLKSGLTPTPFPMSERSFTNESRNVLTGMAPRVSEFSNDESILALCSSSNISFRLFENFVFENRDALITSVAMSDRILNLDSIR